MKAAASLWTETELKRLLTSYLQLEITITRFVWRPDSKSVFFGFYSCQQFKVSLLILYSDTREKHLGCLINKTVGLQYSFRSLPPGISMSQLSAMMADIWILMGIFLWVPSMCCVLPYHCCCLQKLAEQFVAPIGHVKHSRVKVWSSKPIVPNASYYFFEMSVDMEKKKAASFCSQGPRGHVFAMKKPKGIFFNGA